MNGPSSDELFGCAEKLVRSYFGSPLKGSRKRRNCKRHKETRIGRRSQSLPGREVFPVSALSAPSAVGVPSNPPAPGARTMRGWQLRGRSATPRHPEASQRVQVPQQLEAAIGDPAHRSTHVQLFELRHSREMRIPSSVSRAPPISRSVTVWPVKVVETTIGQPVDHDPADPALGNHRDDRVPVLIRGVTVDGDREIRVNSIKRRVGWHRDHPGALCSCRQPARPNWSNPRFTCYQIAGVLCRGDPVTAIREGNLSAVAGASLLPDSRPHERRAMRPVGIRESLRNLGLTNSRGEFVRHLFERSHGGQIDEVDVVREVRPVPENRTC